MSTKDTNIDRISLAFLVVALSSLLVLAAGVSVPLVVVIAMGFVIPGVVGMVISYGALLLSTRAIVNAYAQTKPRRRGAREEQQ